MSADPDHIIVEARGWLTYARDDLRAAEALLARDEVAPRIVCFHAQQAVEKAIKAVLVLRSIPFGKTHDLIALRQLLPENVDVGMTDDALAELSEWAVQPRYPGDSIVVDAAAAMRAVEQAKAILTTMESLAPEL